MKYAILSFALAVVFVSCSKDDSDDDGGGGAVTKTDQITKSAWKFEDAGADQDKNGTMELSLSSQIPACLKDNTLTFAAGGTGTVDAGAEKCDVSEPQSTPITWSFTNNENSVNIGGGGILGINGEFKIITLNDNSLALSKDTTYQGFDIAFIVKLKH